MFISSQEHSVSKIAEYVLKFTVLSQYSECTVGPRATRRPLCSFLAATNQFSVLIGQKMQLTGWHNGNEMRYAWTHKLQLSGPAVHSLYCGTVQEL